MATRNYDPTKVSALIGEHKVVGFDPGQFIQVTMENDLYTFHPSIGPDHGMRVKNPVLQATVTLTLQQTSPSNQRLQQYLTNARNDSGQDSFSLLILNNGGAEEARADSAWIKKEPDLNFSGGGNTESRVWMIETGSLILKFNTDYPLASGQTQND